MKKQSDTRALLGLTQHEMARLLGISRTQLAMHEWEGRQLPIGSMQKIAALLENVETSRKAQERAPKSEQLQAKQRLEKLLKQNEYRSLLVDRKISAAEKKRDTAEKVRLLNGFLKTIAKGIAETTVAGAIERKAAKTVKNPVADTLLELEINREVLKFERNLLEQRLKAL